MHILYNVNTIVHNTQLHPVQTSIRVCSALILKALPDYCLFHLWVSGLQFLWLNLQMNWLKTRRFLSVTYVLFSLFRSFMMNWVTGIHISFTLRGLLELLKCFQTPPRWSSAPSACPSLSRLTRTITNQGRRWNFGLYRLLPMESHTRASSTYISGWVSLKWLVLVILAIFWQNMNRYISSVIIVMGETKLLKTCITKWWHMLIRTVGMQWKLSLNMHKKKKLSQSKCNSIIECVIYWMQLTNQLIRPRDSVNAIKAQLKHAQKKKKLSQSKCNSIIECVIYWMQLTNHLIRPRVWMVWGGTSMLSLKSVFIIWYLYSIL